MAVFFPHNCVSLARLHSSGMVMFVGYDCVWCYSICGVRLCLVRQYLLGMNVFVQCDYLSGMIVFGMKLFVRYDCVWYEVIVRYDCVCSVCMFGMTPFVRYDFVCHEYLSGMIVFVRYGCVCPV